MSGGGAVKQAKSKIIILSVMIFVMLATFGVCVWALLSQRVNANTDIFISDKGQAKSSVVVSDFVGPANNSNLEALSAMPEFSVLATKTRDEDTKTATLDKNIDFSYKNYYRFYILKIDITNLSVDIPVNYTINLLDKDGNDFVFSSQVETKYLQSASEGFSFVTAQNSGRLLLGESKTTYVVLEVVDGIDLWDLTTVEKTNFTLKVEVSA